MRLRPHLSEWYASLPDSDSKLPRVSVVVLNWCDEPATAACLESLADSGYPELSVVLVDNGSPDGSGEAVATRFPEAEFIQTGSNLGYSGGNNRGIRHALASGADFVLILNHDTVVEDGCISRLVDTALEFTEAGAVAPTIVRMDDPGSVWYGGGAFDPVRALGIHWNGAGPHAKEARDVTFFSGCAVLFRAEALSEAEGFREDYFLYVEDAELSVRMVRDGWRLLHEPRARVRHRVPPRGSEPSPDQIRFRDRNRRRLAREHLGAGGRARFHAWFLPTRLIHLARYVGKGDLPRARAILRGLSER
jgi:GT2 family glycosyltransferase